MLGEEQDNLTTVWNVLQKKHSKIYLTNKTCHLLIIFLFTNLCHHDHHKVLLTDFVFFKSRVIAEDFTCEEKEKWALHFYWLYLTWTRKDVTIDGIMFYHSIDGCWVDRLPAFVTTSGSFCYIVFEQGIYTRLRKVSLGRSHKTPLCLICYNMLILYIHSVADMFFSRFLVWIGRIH